MHTLLCCFYVSVFCDVLLLFLVGGGEYTSNEQGRIELNIPAVFNVDRSTTSLGRLAVTMLEIHYVVGRLPVRFDDT